MPSCPLGHGPARPAALNASARARACYDQLRACGLSHCVALRRLGNRLAGGGVTERERAAWWHCGARGRRRPRG